MSAYRFYPLRERPEFGVLASKIKPHRVAKFIRHNGWAKLSAPDPIEAPAPDGATWGACGHPKTPANTQSVGAAGFRCRICRRAISRKCGSRVRGASA